MEKTLFTNTEQIDELLPNITQMIYEYLNGDKDIYRHTLLIIGISNRTYELTESAIWAIDNNRPFTATNMLRSLIETLAFCDNASKDLMKTDNISEFEKKSEQLLMGSRDETTKHQAVNILTYIDHSVKTYPNLRKNYDDISELVHPNSASHFYSGKSEDGKRKVEMKIPFYEFKGSDKKMVINQTGECCSHIIKIIKKLTGHLQSIKK